MTEIAGSKDRFFQISNYTDLENTVSSLENIINGMEGKPIFHSIKKALVWFVEIRKNI